MSWKWYCDHIRHRQVLPCLQLLVKPLLEKNPFNADRFFNKGVEFGSGSCFLCVLILQNYNESLGNPVDCFYLLSIYQLTSIREKLLNENLVRMT